MKAINLFLVGLICLLGSSAEAQKMVPHSFRYTGDPPGRDHLRFLTQVTQPHTTFLRLYFAGTELGENSYLVLEGSDGARQELRKQDLRDWHYSSAYFNGQSVNVSLFAAAGDRNTVRLSDVRITDERARSARQAAGNPGLSARTVTSTATNLTETHPYAKAVGRFTNGTHAYGTGWIAPNGSIVTSWNMYDHYFSQTDPYDVIEFNVPPSVGGTVMHPAPQDQYPLKNRTLPRSGSLYFKAEPYLSSWFFYYGWVVFEPLPNGTGLRPGERQQEYFRIATNPGNFAIDAKGNGGIPVDIFHYGADGAVLEGTTTYKTLQLTQTSLLEQNEHLTTLKNGDRDRFMIYETPSFSGDMGGPVTYQGSNVAIGVHNQSSVTKSTFGEPDIALPGYGLGFQDEAFRDEVARFYQAKSAYVDAEGLYDQPTGEIHKPYRTLQQAAQHAPSDYTVYIARGTYSGAVTFNRPLTLRAPVGRVIIGSSNGGARKAAESSIARNRALAETLGAHERPESAETAEKVRAYPNPFREKTDITYRFEERGPVSVRILNTAGVPVATLTPNQAATGRTGVQWNGTDQNGTPLPAGLYLVQVNDGTQTFTTKLLKL
ncbi:T9SS type A sorting domain-containing protein [Larkinella soli]|uniref:T9SS type A sorting domain-containing protein n=1 Tax=Larkinella soli TaxID=1770527 RepID=UPI000FFC57FE|nr:T9SS type A sorting domain-containing protein [Larkinella soli]